MATLFQLPKPVPVSAGNSYPLARAYFFAFGTTTPITTYTTAALSVAHAHPVVADANGVFAPIFINEAVNTAYKFRLNTSADALVYEIDAIPTTLSQASLGAVLYPQTAAESSAGITPTNYAYEPGDVRRYGDNTTPGTTDMTAAIQAAYTANAGLRVTFQPEAYLVTSAISVPANTVTYANGATITWNSQVKGITLGSGAEWYGGRLVGPGGGTYGSSGYAMYCSGTRGANGAIAPTYIDGPRIVGVEIDGWEYAGIYLAYLRDAWVTDNKIENCGYVGVGGISVEDVHVTHNKIDTIAGSGAPDTYGIFLDRQEDTETRDPRSRRCWIDDNTVRNVTNWEAIDTHGSEDFSICRNTIEGCRFGIAVTGSDILGTNSLGVRRVVVADNKIVGSNNGAAIFVVGAVTGTTVNQYAEQVTVANNVINSGGWDNDSAEGAFRFYATRNLKVIGNTLRRPWYSGIHFAFQNRDFLAVGNSITDPRNSTNAFPACVSVSSNDNTGRISDGSLIFEDAAASTHVAVIGISISGSLTGLDLEIGPHHHIGISASKLTYNEGTATGVNAEGLMRARGTGTLSTGTLAVTFAKRFPSTPKVLIGLNDALNPVRAHTISATGFTAAGTTTDSFTWLATT